MLNSSFLHIPSIGAIGAITEKEIWNNGIRTMDDFLESSPDFISSNKGKNIIEYIHSSKEKLSSKDARYFYDNLPSKEHWRIFREYQNVTANLDIEWRLWS
jgi:hypothetical protein